MEKKKNLERGYDRVKRNIDFSHVRKHQRSTPKRKKFEGRKKWVEIQININIKKRETSIEEIKNRREKKTKQIQERKITPKCRYCNKFFRTNKALEMHIFQVHERRGTKTDKVKFEWKKKKLFLGL